MLLHVEKVSQPVFHTKINPKYSHLNQLTKVAPFFVFVFDVYSNHVAGSFNVCPENPRERLSTTDPATKWMDS